MVGLTEVVVQYQTGALSCQGTGLGDCGTYRCIHRSCGWPGSRSRSRGPCVDRRGHAPCTALPAAWRRRGSNRIRPAPGSHPLGSAAPARCTGTARCSPGRWWAAERKRRAVSLGSQLALPSLRPFRHSRSLPDCRGLAGAPKRG